VTKRQEGCTKGKKKEAPSGSIKPLHLDSQKKESREIGKRLKTSFNQRGGKLRELIILKKGKRGRKSRIEEGKVQARHSRNVVKSSTWPHGVIKPTQQGLKVGEVAKGADRSFSKKAGSSFERGGLATPSSRARTGFKPKRKENGIRVSQPTRRDWIYNLTNSGRK